METVATTSVRISVAFLLSVDNLLPVIPSQPNTSSSQNNVMLNSWADHCQPPSSLSWASVSDLLSHLNCGVNSLQQIFVKALYLGLATRESHHNFLHSNRGEEHIYYAMVGSMEPSCNCILKHTWTHSYMNSV